MDQIVFVTQKTKVEFLVEPQDGMIIKGDSRYYYKEFKETLNVLRDRIPVRTESPEKVYFTRTLLKRGKDFGEKLVEDTFRKLGFTIIAPEKLSLEEQLILLRNCKYFATTEGSIAHNVIFCADGVNNIIIRKVCGLISYQFTLMDIRKANVTYIDSGITLFFLIAFWYGPFLLCRRDNLIKFARDFGNIKLRTHLSKIELLKYWGLLTYRSFRWRQKPIKCNHFKYYYKLFKHLFWH